MRALLCGTKRRSLARVLGKALKKSGWAVHLFSRQAEEGLSDGVKMHKADITDISTINKLLDQVSPTLVVISADPGFAFGDIADIGLEEARNFLHAKIFGSVNVVALLVRRNTSSKIVFLCGAKEKKIKGAFLYELVNTTFMKFVDLINQEYSAHGIQAYYLETPAIEGSRLLAEYNDHVELSIKGYPRDVILTNFEQIVEGRVEPGFVPFHGEVL